MQASSTAAFGRTDGAQGTTHLGRAGAAVAASLVVALLATVLWSALAGRTPPGSHPAVFTGALVLEDERPLSVLDVATGQVTVRLPGVYQEVGADSYAAVQAVPVAGGTFLVNRADGTFNLLGADDYVLDPTGGGIGLGALPGATGAAGLADGADAYIVREAPRSTVSLVDASVVEAGTRSGPVRPLGFAALDGTASGAGAGAVVAGGDLWLLVAPPAGGCRLEQLSPAEGGRGALTVRTRVRLPTPCATAALAAPGGRSGADVVLVSPGRARVLAPAGRGVASDVALAGTAGASALVPARGGDGTAWVLARVGATWSLAGVGPGGAPLGARPLAGWGSSTAPAPPAVVGGALYTYDRAAAAAPALWRVDTATAAVGTVPGQARYPARSAAEQASFGAAEVRVVGDRVVFNNPASLLAVVAFTDGSHRPVVIDKSTALDVSATGPGVPDLGGHPLGATGSPGQPTPQGPTAPAPAAAAPVQVNPQVTCATTTVRPYAPQVTAVTPAAETALVTWAYQLLDQQDCEPTTWAVSVRALSGPVQPARPVQVVDGQQQLDLTGLRPATTYQATVTAFLNASSTASQPVTFTTEPKGPDAPVRVTTVADGQGHWVVSWAACAGTACEVPADEWTVTGTACGGSFVGAPPSVQVPAGTGSVTVDATATGLLGDSLSFSVQGATSGGLAGDPTTDGSCTQAWAPPDPTNLHLAAAATPAGATLTATLTLTTTGTQAEAYGSSAATFVYSVGGHTVGPTNQTTVTVPGLAPATTYTPTVQVWPAGHQPAAVTVTGPPFSQTVPWPSGLTLAATSSTGADGDTGTVTATIGGLAPGGYTATATLTCGNTTDSGLQGGVSGGTVSFAGIDLVGMGGPCGLSTTLTDTDDPNPYGVASPALTTRFQLGQQPADDFSVAYDQACVLTYCADLAADISYRGSQPPYDPPAGRRWVVAAYEGTAPGRTACSSASSDGPSFPWTLSLVDCPDPSKLDLTVSYTYLGTTQTIDLGAPSGTPATTTTTPTTVPPTTTPSTTTPPSSTPPSSTPTTPPTSGAAAQAAGPASVLARATGPAAGGSDLPLALGLAGVGAAAAVVHRRPRRRP